ncbi:unnamed protein product [Didymodactylos carnosus]|uniref:Tetratricopeptide repeat protein n=1 Tax=Didymodactylos carnosus TaxID=1234261 RepID=A0A8S2LCK3_9BILA|nr:unnamed protein product [Didymodactylos carnosus]CAF3892725.1 unnamed protein product [Didymodactylos carnosus]
MIRRDKRIYQLVLEYYNKCLDICNTRFLINHPLLADTVVNIATVYAHQSKQEQALILYKKAVRIQSTTLPLKHPLLSNIHSNIDAVYEQLNNYNLALKQCTIASNILNEQSLTSTYPLIITI